MNLLNEIAKLQVICMKHKADESQVFGYDATFADEQKW